MLYLIYIYRRYIYLCVNRVLKVRLFDILGYFCAYESFVIKSYNYNLELNIQ